MKKMLIALTASAALAAPAYAVSLSTSDGPPIVAPFTTTYTFDPGSTGPFPVANVRIANSSTTAAQPLGSTLPFYSVGPSTTNPVTIAYASTWGSQFYLYWGSVDDYNAIELLDAANVVIATVSGAMVMNPDNATGSQTSLSENRNVTVTLTGAERAAVASLRFRSDFGQAPTNAFEFDNFSVAAIPEPATWAMMMMGFGLIGAALRRGRRIKPVLA